MYVEGLIRINLIPNFPSRHGCGQEGVRADPVPVVPEQPGGAERVLPGGGHGGEGRGVSAGPPPGPRPGPGRRQGGAQAPQDAGGQRRGEEGGAGVGRGGRHRQRYQQEHGEEDGRLGEGVLLSQSDKVLLLQSTLHTLVSYMKRIVEEMYLHFTCLVQLFDVLTNVLRF